MENAIKWILEKTEATEIQWRRLKTSPSVPLKDNTLGATYEAKCAKESKKLFNKVYVGLHGDK
jgi:hypothetical protein